MEKKQLKHRTISRGFTLLEMLVVILIIGISLCWGIIKTATFIESYRLHYATEKVLDLLNIARQQAILHSTVLALNLDQQPWQAYCFMPNFLDHDPRWQPNCDLKIIQQKISNTPLSHPLQLQIDQQTKTIRSVDTSSAQQTPLTFTIIFYPDGQITPFQLILSSKHHPKKYHIVGETDGGIRILEGEIS